MSNYRLTAAAIMTVLIGGGLFLYEPPKTVTVERPKKVEKQENPVHGFGYIDFEQVQNKHSDGEKLKDLIGKEIRLKIELNEMMRPVFPPKLPEIDTKPFEDSARERNMKNIISQFADLNARKKRLAEEYKKQTEPDYIERRNSVRDVYVNEAFNITLKLENAKLLHLKPEQIQELEKRLDELVIERNAKQRELLEAWTAEINAHVDAQFAEEFARIKRESDEMKEKYSEEALQKIRDTQERNQALMQAAMQEIAFRQIRRRELFEELKNTSDQRVKLEDKIISSIVNEAGKLGALYKLQMVLIKHEKNYYEDKFSQNADINFKLNAKKSPGALIFEGTDTKDLTKDLLKVIH